MPVPGAMQSRSSAATADRQEAGTAIRHDAVAQLLAASPRLVAQRTIADAVQNSPRVVSGQSGWQGVARGDVVQRVGIDTIEDDAVETDHATRVGVQLALDKDGNVASVMVAGRPRSPFTGTMGDHVTAFGVHVINLRKAMQGKSLADARTSLKAMVAAMGTLPGYAYALANTGNAADQPEWQRRRTQLAEADSHDPGASQDAMVAHLQWSAALYLEVREGVPFSLVNTRSVTANSGRGRGEAGFLKNLAGYEPPAEAEDHTKRVKFDDGDGKARAVAGSGEEGALSELERDLVLGLFDEDAVAWFTSSHATRQQEALTRMMPGHAAMDTIGNETTDALKAHIAKQHVASMFPLAGTRAGKFEQAVLEKIEEAHQRRVKGDGLYWHQQLNLVQMRLANAGAVTDTQVQWLRQEGRSAMNDAMLGLQLAAKVVEISTPSNKERQAQVLAELAEHMARQVSDVDEIVDFAVFAGKKPAAQLRIGLKGYFMAAAEVCHRFRIAFVALDHKLIPGGLPENALVKIDAALDRLVALREAVEKRIAAPEDEVDIVSDTDVAVATGTVTVSSSPGDTTMAPEDDEKKGVKRKRDPVIDDMRIEATEEEIAARRKLVGRIANRPTDPTPNEALAATHANAILGELSSSTGNSFTVVIRLDAWGNINVVSLRGRPPSPFTGTMGAHTTAWLVWVNALVRQLSGVPLDQAGQRLTVFAHELLIDASKQNDLIAKAQNGLRR